MEHKAERHPLKRIFILMIVVFVAVFAWRVGERISADALSMVIGIFFGTLASVPAAILVLAASRRGETRAPRAPHPAGWGSGSGGNPPVIVVSPPMMPMPQGGNLPTQSWQQFPYGDDQAMQGRRHFRVVGEDDAWLDR